MHLESSLIDFLCGKVDQQLTLADIPTQLKRDPHETSAWLRDLRARGGVALVDDPEGGILEILSITVKPHIHVIKQQLEDARRASTGGTVVNIQNVGDNSNSIQGSGNSISQSVHSGGEVEAILIAFKSLVSQVEAMKADPREKEALLRELKPVKEEILSPNTSPGKLMRWGKAAKGILEAAATAEGVLGLAGRISAAAALWKFLS